jgi:hypothetical protein
MPLRDVSEIELNHESFKKWLTDAGTAIEEAALSIVATEMNLMELQMAIELVMKNWLQLRDEMELE